MDDEAIFLPDVLQVYQSPIADVLCDERGWNEQGIKRERERERERRGGGGEGKTRSEYKPRFRSRVPRYA